MRIPALLLAVGLLAGCGTTRFGEPQPLDMTLAVGLPENLCDSVPPESAPAWRLAEASHETTGGFTKAVATCEMTGRLRGEPLVLSLRVESRGGEDEEEAGDVMESLATAECNDLIPIAHAADDSETAERFNELFREFDGGGASSPYRAIA